MANHSKYDEWNDLARRAQEGDKRAYNRLLRDIVPFIRSVLIPKLANPDWADDITQDILVSVHKSLKTYSPDRPFKPWLLAIVSFRRTDYLRAYYRQNKDKQTSLDNPEFIATHVTNDGGAGEGIDVERALGDLPADQSKIFRMIKIQGFSAKEVANEMKMGVSAVKVSAHRTMKKLKEKLS